MTPKAYLNQAYRLEQRIRLHQEELENLRMLASSVGSPGFEEHYNPNRPNDAPFVKTLDRIWEKEKKVNEERCYAWLLNPYKVLKIICYVNDMYQNRHTLERKNSKRRAKCKQHEVSINNFYSSGEVVSLQNLYKYERENKPWQGGHHSSPIEHERKAHERVYRNADGSVRKVVQIGETTVNKGNKRDKAVEVRKKSISDLSTGNMELF